MCFEHCTLISRRIWKCILVQSSTDYSHIIIIQMTNMHRVMGPHYDDDCCHQNSSFCRIERADWRACGPREGYKWPQAMTFTCPSKCTCISDKSASIVPTKCFIPVVIFCKTCNVPINTWIFLIMNTIKQLLFFLSSITAKLTYLLLIFSLKTEIKNTHLSGGQLAGRKN